MSHAFEISANCKRYKTTAKTAPPVTNDPKTSNHGLSLNPVVIQVIATVNNVMNNRGVNPVEFKTRSNCG